MKVLLIEDDQDTLKILEKLLVKLGHIVIKFNDGKSGYSYLEDSTKKLSPPDLIITDLNVPGMDGTEIVTKIRDDLDWDIPIIVSSGFLNAFVKKELEELGNILVLEKPIKKEKLIEILESLKED